MNVLRYIVGVMGLVSFLSVSAVKAQTNDLAPIEIATDRPDQTESAFLVPAKALQWETGALYEKEERDNQLLENVTYNTSLFRYGISQFLELRFIFDVVSEKTTLLQSPLPENTITESGLTNLTIGTKLKVNEASGIWPQVSFIGHLTLPKMSFTTLSPEYLAPAFRFCFEHELSSKTSIGYNLGASWDGSSTAPEYLYTLAFGADITDKLGAFIESYGFLYPDDAPNYLIDGGFTYSPRPNLQLDASAGYSLQHFYMEEDVSYYFLSAGVSWAFRTGS